MSALFSHTSTYFTYYTSCRLVGDLFLLQIDYCAGDYNFCFPSQSRELKIAWCWSVLFFHCLVAICVLFPFSLGIVVFVGYIRSFLRVEWPQVSFCFYFFLSLFCLCLSSSISFTWWFSNHNQWLVWRNGAFLAYVCPLYTDRNFFLSEINRLFVFISRSFFYVQILFVLVFLSMSTFFSPPYSSCDEHWFQNDPRPPCFRVSELSVGSFFFFFSFILIYLFSFFCRL